MANVLLAIHFVCIQLNCPFANSPTAFAKSPIAKNPTTTYTIHTYITIIMKLPPVYFLLLDKEKHVHHTNRENDDSNDEMIINRTIKIWIKQNTDISNINLNNK